MNGSYFGHRHFALFVHYTEVRSRSSSLLSSRCFTRNVWEDEYPVIWSYIRYIRLRQATYKDLALCEKSNNHSDISSNCAYLYKTCNDGTCVHDSLVCDGRPHCLHGEDEADCQHICSAHTHQCMSHCHYKDLCSCSSEYFQCLSGGCVPLQKLCDKTPHCLDASDEPPTCVYQTPEQLGRHSVFLHINTYINDLIQQNMDILRVCLQDKDATVHPVHSVEYTMISQQPPCSPFSISSDIRFLCKLTDTSIHEPQHYFSLDRLCVYDHDCDDQYESHCLNGFHLLKCEHMYCVRRFKCPSSYCVSFDHICNKVCDCPHCEDESICNKLLCPGMVLMEQMGVGLRCSRDIAALKHSMNMRQVIRRKGLNITHDFPVFVHLEDVGYLTDFILIPQVVVYCKILRFTSVFSNVSILHHMVSVRWLVLSYNSIQDIPDSMFGSMSQLILLDLSHNIITYLSHTTLCALRNLQYISLHHNLITTLQSAMFNYISNVQVLLLESNNINPQPVIMDSSLAFLYRLSSDIPRLCCVFKTATFCSLPFPFFISCSDMITSKALIVMGWIIGLSTSCLSFLCLILFLYKICIDDIQTPKAVLLFSVNLNLAELMISLCLLSYSVINVVYHDIFGITADQWRHSWKCLSLESLFSISSRSSLAYAVCLSIHFAIHIPSVVRIESSQMATYCQIIMIWLFITSTSITIQMLENIREIDPFNYFCFPFTTLLPSDPLIIGLQIVMILSDCSFVILSVCSHCYL